MTTTAPDRQPATPGQALRMAADRWQCHADVEIDTWDGAAEEVADLRRWADELDAAATYSLPAEPPETVTELWAADGGKVERRTAEHGGWWYRGMVWRWLLLVEEAGPLSTAPPAGTEADHG